jgi:hypothetical protein
MIQIRRATNYFKGPWHEASTNEGVRTVECSDFDSFFQFVDRGFGDADLGWLWRGQRDANWAILSSFGRVGKGADSLLRTYRNAVARSTHVEYEVSSDIFGESELRLWSLGQHHGLLTPLIDWTVYPYVALFFAFAEANDASQERAVFALNWQMVASANFGLRMKAETFAGKIEHPPYEEVFQDYLTRRFKQNFADELDRIARSDITPPMRKRLAEWEHEYQKRMQLRTFIPRTNENPRIHSQGGRHVYAPDGISVESWIRTCITNGHLQPTDVVLTKIILPNHQRQQVLRGLSKMNINYLSLFPDFEGAARHCNMALFDEPLGLFRMRDY